MPAESMQGSLGGATHGRASQAIGLNPLSTLFPQPGGFQPGFPHFPTPLYMDVLADKIML